MNENEERTSILLELGCEEIKTMSRALAILAKEYMAYNACGRIAIAGITHAIIQTLEEMEIADKRLEEFQAKSNDE